MVVSKSERRLIPPLQNAQIPSKRITGRRSFIKRELKTPSAPSLVIIFPSLSFSVVIEEETEEEEEEDSDDDDDDDDDDVEGGDIGEDEDAAVFDDPSLSLKSSPSGVVAENIKKLDLKGLIEIP